jgi:hypothetical protein
MKPAPSATVCSCASLTAAPLSAGLGRPKPSRADTQVVLGHVVVDTPTLPDAAVSRYATQTGLAAPTQTRGASEVDASTRSRRRTQSRREGAGRERGICGL